MPWHRPILFAGLTAFGVSVATGCASVGKPDAVVRGQLATPMLVANAPWVPPTPPPPFDNGPKVPAFVAPVGPKTPDFVAAVVPVVPDLGAPVVPLSHSELPELLAIPLTIPEPSRETLPVPRPIAPRTLPIEPVAAAPLPAEPVTPEPVAGTAHPDESPKPEGPAIGTVSVGGRELSFAKLPELIGAGDGTTTRVISTGCSTCGDTGGGCTTCEPFPAQCGLAARVVGGLYEALCCPDPCYKPKWIPLADTAFFTPSARPVSHTRLRWDYTRFGMFPDRGEYFWARADGNGKGPRPVNALGIPRVDTHELSQYTETAAGPGFSAYFVTPYRSVNPIFADPPSAAGFGDMTIGTKGVLFDSELFLLTLQFQTTLPVGNAAKGLGTGHVSLEPSLLFGLRVSPKSYLQGQLAQWIPLGGDPTYSGAMMHYHLAYNHILWQPISQVQLIGTFEMHGYSWQDGGFTDPATGFRNASGSNILQAGPGLRMFYCDKYDFGVGTNFGVTGKNSIGEQLRFEMRIRF